MDQVFLSPTGSCPLPCPAQHRRSHTRCRRQDRWGFHTCSRLKRPGPFRSYNRESAGFSVVHLKRVRVQTNLCDVPQPADSCVFRNQDWCFLYPHQCSWVIRATGDASGAKFSCAGKPSILMLLVLFFTTFLLFQPASAGVWCGRIFTVASSVVLWNREPAHSGLAPIAQDAGPSAADSLSSDSHRGRQETPPPRSTPRDHMESL